MKIRFAEKSDIEILSTYDKHIRITELESAVLLGRVIVAEDNGTLISWLRWNHNDCLLGKTNEDEGV